MITFSGSLTFTFKWLVLCVRFPFGFFKSFLALTATNAGGVVITLISECSWFANKMTISLAIAQNFDFIHRVEILNSMEIFDLGKY